MNTIVAPTTVMLGSWCADRSVSYSSANQISALYLYCGSSYDRFCEVIIFLHSLTFYSVFFLLLFPLWLELYFTVMYQYNTIQYNTTQYNTIQHNTIQYNTIQ